MRHYTFIELFRLSQEELFGLRRWFSSNLNQLPGDAPEYPAITSNLRKVRQVLAIRRFLRG